MATALAGEPTGSNMREDQPLGAKRAGGWDSALDTDAAQLAVTAAGSVFSSNSATTSETQFEEDN
jgi:hypothetical protein